MLLSELIQQAQRVLAERGDGDVWVYNYKYNGWCPPSGIVTDQHDGEAPDHWIMY